MHCVAAGCAAEAFQSHLCRIVGAGGCPVVIAQWQSTGCTSQVSWVRFPATAGLFTFLYFCLITSKFHFVCMWSVSCLVSGRWGGGGGGGGSSTVCSTCFLSCLML